MDGMPVYCGPLSWSHLDVLGWNSSVKSCQQLPDSWLASSFRPGVWTCCTCLLSKGTSCYILQTGLKQCTAIASLVIHWVSGFPVCLPVGTLGKDHISCRCLRYLCWWWSSRLSPGPGAWFFQFLSGCRVVVLRYLVASLFVLGIVVLWNWLRLQQIVRHRRTNIAEGSLATLWCCLAILECSDNDLFEGVQIWVVFFMTGSAFLVRSLSVIW